MMVAGFFVNGPYALITTAVSADLGTHKSLAGACLLALACLCCIITCFAVCGQHQQHCR
jgi:OPA family glycerol-3-phosphate transporter-like MFS transporter 1/2